MRLLTVSPFIYPTLNESDASDQLASSGPQCWLKFPLKA